MSGTVLIFGGAGFVGSYVVEELLSRNYKVIVADIHEGHIAHNNLKYKYCDIRDREQIKNAFTEDVECVYNFAGFANLERAVSSPVPTIELNILGNLYILEELRSNPNVKRYVYASSAYALNDKGSFYGISKLASEKLIEEYRKRYGIVYTILRYGSIYSERDFDNNYLYSLIKNIIQTHKVIHKGDGTEVREYIHAADVAKMAVDVIESDKYECQYMILTGVERMRRIELFEMIREILGEEFDVELQENAKTEHYKITPYKFQPSVSRKMVSDSYIDMGQGILECIKQIKNSLADEI